MPGWLRRGYLEQAAKLRAREALHHATVIALGAGRMAAREHARLRRAWRREAGYEEAVKVKDAGQMDAVLGAAGMPVRRVKRGG